MASEKQLERHFQKLIIIITTRVEVKIYLPLTELHCFTLEK